MIPLRLARELTYQLERAGEHERLARALASVPVFLVLNTGEGVSDVLTLWQQLAVRGHNPEKYYPDALDVLRKNGSSLLPDALSTVNGLFDARGAYDLSVEVLTELLAWAEERKDETRAMEAVRRLGGIGLERGDYDLAMTRFTQSLAVAESLGDKRGMSCAIGSMGIVHSMQGRYDEAMSCYERDLALSESLGDKSGMSKTICNMGIIHMEQGRYSEAMACYERHYAMSESFGNKRGMSNAIVNMGVVHVGQCRYAEAMACYERSIALAESLGDKRLMAMTNGNMGTVHMDQGRHGEAMACYERHLALAESLGDKLGISAAIGQMGGVHLELGRHEDALRSFRSALDGHRAISFRQGMTRWFEGIGRTLVESGGDLTEARENAEECVRISEEIGKPDTLFAGRVLLARIDAAEGNTTLAIEKLEAMLAEATDEEQVADLHYWLWKIGQPVSFPRKRESRPGDSNLDSRFRGNDIEALSRYQSLYSHIPKFEFRKRMAELKGERIPMSADDLERESASMLVEE